MYLQGYKNNASQYQDIHKEETSARQTICSCAHCKTNWRVIVSETCSFIPFLHYKDTTVNTILTGCCLPQST